MVPLLTIVLLSVKVSVEQLGVVESFELLPDGSCTAVTSSNRSRFVKLYLEWVLNNSCYDQFNAFYRGFHSVVASNALIVSTHCSTPSWCIVPIGLSSSTTSADPWNSGGGIHLLLKSFRIYLRLS